VSAPVVRLLDVRVWGHKLLPGHTVYVRGKYPKRVWRCSRHDCWWSHYETEPVA